MEGEGRRGEKIEETEKGKDRKLGDRGHKKERTGIK